MRRNSFHLLVIDEDPTPRADVVATLRAAGFAAEGASPVIAGQSLVGNGPLPDMVVVDLDRPWETRVVMAAMRSLRRLVEIPVVGLSIVPPMPLLMARYPLIHVRKPIIAEELVAAVHVARRTNAHTRQMPPVSLAFPID